MGSRGALKGVDYGKIKKKINENQGIDMSSPRDFKAEADLECKISVPGSKDKIKK